MVLLGLALALSALLVWRNMAKQADGFQGRAPGPLPTAENPVVTANGFEVNTSLSKITGNLGPTDSSRTIQIVDPSINTEVWTTGMKQSDSTEVKNYILLSSMSGPYSLPKAPNDIAQKGMELPGIGPIVELIRKVSDSKYVNALDGTDVIPYIGILYKVNTATVYPLLNSISSASSTDSPFPWDMIVDPTNLAQFKWIKGQTQALTPEGVKELIFISNKRSFMNLKDINAIIDSAANKDSANPMQMIYPVVKVNDKFVDARTKPITYAVQEFVTRKGVLMRYAGIGTAIVATVALLFVGIRTVMRKSDSPEIPMATVAPAPMKPNNKKPVNRPNNNPTAPAS